MATYFGEILPVVSRAVDDDEEDDENACPDEKDAKPSFVWETIGERRSSLPSVVVVGIGPIACGFLQAYFFKNDNPATGKILMKKRVYRDGDNSEQEQIESTVCEEYVDAENNLLYCLVFEELESELAVQFSQHIFARTKTATNFITLCSRHVSQFYSSQIDAKQLSPPFLRCLCSSHFSEKFPVPYLEQPNFVAGVAAAVMIHCQIHHIPCVVYLCLTDVMEVDSINVDAYLPILRHNPFTNKLKINVDAKIRFQRLQRKKPTHSNLYL